MKCLNCNKEIMEGITNCPYCGTNLYEATYLEEEKAKHKKKLGVAGIIGIGLLTVFIIVIASVLIKNGIKEKKEKQYLASVQDIVDTAFQEATSEHKEMSVSLAIQSKFTISGDGSTGGGSYNNTADVDFRDSEVYISNGLSEYRYWMDDAFSPIEGRDDHYTIYSDEGITPWRQKGDQSWAEMPYECVAAEDYLCFFDDMYEEQSTMQLDSDGRGANFEDGDATDEEGDYLYSDIKGEIILTGYLANAGALGESYLKLLDYAEFEPTRGSVEGLSYELRINKNTKRITSVTFSMEDFARYVVFGNDGEDSLHTSGSGTYTITYNSFDTANEFSMPAEVCDKIAVAKAEAEAEAQAMKEKLGAILTEEEISVYEIYRDNMPEVDEWMVYQFVDINRDGTWELLCEDQVSGCAQLYYIDRKGRIEALDEWVYTNELYYTTDGMLVDKGGHGNSIGTIYPMQIFMYDKASGNYNKTHEFEIEVKDWDTFSSLTDFTSIEKNADVMEYRVDGKQYASYDEGLSVFEGFYTQEGAKKINGQGYVAELSDACLSAKYVEIYQGYIDKNISLQYQPRYYFADFNKDKILDLVILDVNPDICMEELEENIDTVEKNKLYVLVTVNGEIQMVELSGGNISGVYMNSESAFSVQSYISERNDKSWQQDIYVYNIGSTVECIINASLKGGDEIEVISIINGGSATAEQFSDLINEYWSMERAENGFSYDSMNDCIERAYCATITTD